MPSHLQFSHQCICSFYRRSVDWFDGLDTFMRYICHRSWFGGWLLPQEKSYFALDLPHGWWVFGLDQALHGDIDIIQFKYFCEILRKQVIYMYTCIVTLMCYLFHA